jgi:hypothetical protein
MSSLEKSVHQVLHQLPEKDQYAVLAFAEFLLQRLAVVELEKPRQVPRDIPRPAIETVPAALKRLRQTYPMLDAADLLAEASDLLSQHLMLGRSADDVIDDMEALFQRHYQLYQER